MTTNTIAGDNDPKYYRGALIVDICKLGAMNDDLTTDIWHPRNAVYRVPLPNPTDEEMANRMADIIFCAVVDDHPDIDHDKALEQAIIDARRMMVEPAYERLFNGGRGPRSLDDIVRDYRR